MHFIKDSRIDFLCTHPPYANIIKYSKGIEGDISLLGVDDFLDKMQKVAEEAFRVLKKGNSIRLSYDGVLPSCGIYIFLYFKSNSIHKE